MKKRAAMELSVGTIVIIVLSMSMLILGLVLIKGLFSGATDVTDMTNEQIKNQIQKKFGEEKKFVVYPDTRQIEVKPGKPKAFGFGIKNLIQGKIDKTFSYEVKVSDPDITKKCGISPGVATGWISNGRTEQNIDIPAGDIFAGKVLLNIPEGSSFCEFRYRITAKYGEQAYATDFMDIIIRS